MGRQSCANEQAADGDSEIEETSPKCWGLAMLHARLAAYTRFSLRSPPSRDARTAREAMRKCDRESVGGQGVSGWKVLAPQRPGRHQHKNGPNLVLPKRRRAFDHGAFLVDGG